jgi:hypothetical protein
MYKKLVFFAALFLTFSVVAASSHNVRGHTTKKGTYIAPHRQTNSNHTQHDNWSSKPNVNPNTGKSGSKKPKN